MSSPRISAWSWAIAIAAWTATQLAAQEYPRKPVRIVATEPGGGGDIVARLVAQGLTSAWKQQVIVDNRSGIIANEVAARAPADGYSLLCNASAMWLWPFLSRGATWDPLRDFAPVALAVRQPMIVVVHPALPVTSVKELIAFAKSKPGALNYGISGLGVSTHLATELFNSQSGISVVPVNYKGTAAAITGLIGNQIQMMFANAASVTPHIKSGRLTALAVTTSRPSPVAPGVPTVASSGLPGFEADIILGLFAPAGIPATLVRRLNQDIVLALNKGDVKEKLFNIGMEVIAGSPEDLLAAVKLEMAKWGKGIKDGNIRAG